MYITFRLQGGIGKVAKEMGFCKDISLKLDCLDAQNGEEPRSINLEAQLMLGSF